MGILKSFLMALGMFSTIPVPRNSWNDKYMNLVILNLMLVGFFIGSIWFILTSFLLTMDMPILITSSLVLLIPFFLSGFLHVDGYMDTADAIFSRRDTSEKRRILKDSSVGAFAVIALVCLMLLQFSIIHTILMQNRCLFIFIFITIISRAVAGLAVLNLKPISETGYMATFKLNTDIRHSIVIVLTIVITLIIAYIVGGVDLIAPLIISLIASAFMTFYVYKQLQGFSGDLCGWVITTSELCGLLFFAIL